MADNQDYVDQYQKRRVALSNGAYAPLHMVSFPARFLTDGAFGDYSRIRADIGSTGFFAGREFEAYHTFSGPNGLDLSIGEKRTFQVVTQTNVIINSIGLQLNSGEAHLYTYAGGTPSGTFGTSITPLKSNTITTASSYTSQTTIAYGGTVSGGTEYGDIWVDAGLNPAKSALVAGVGGDSKGRAAGTYYFVIDAVSACTGQLVVRWEERP